MSRDEAVKLSSGLLLRGSMDLVEVSMTSAGGRQLRVTDHKAGGEVPPKGVEVGGGEILQAALYALVLEVLFPESADPQAPTGRLDYCTSQGEFSDRDVPLSSGLRRSVKLLSESLELRLDIGSFPALPRPEACKDCDFRSVCGPHEEFRMGRKDRSSFDDIHELRLRR